MDGCGRGNMPSAGGVGGINRNRSTQALSSQMKAARLDCNTEGSWRPPQVELLPRRPLATLAAYLGATQPAVDDSGGCNLCYRFECNLCSSPNKLGLYA